MGKRIMKKLIISIFIILFCVCQTSAWVLAPIVGGVEEEATSPCPSYYADAVLSWDGDHTSGVLNACNSAGEAVLFTSSDADISTYGEGGSNALQVDNADEFMHYTQTANQYLAPKTTAQTICMKVYVSAFPDAQAGIFAAGNAGQVDFVRMAYRNQLSTSRLFGYYYVYTGTDQSILADSIPEASWEVIAYSWQVPNDPATTHAVNPGDGAPGWTDGWSAATELLDVMTNNATYISVGEQYYSDPGDTEYYIIDEWAVFNGYQVNCSDYME